MYPWWLSPHLRGVGLGCAFGELGFILFPFDISYFSSYLIVNSFKVFKDIKK